MAQPYMNSFQSTKRALLEMLMETTLPGNKLPAETDLAKRMRVSVVTLRQALTALEAEGYITKKQGTGSFVHVHAFEPYLRSDMGDNMTDFVGSVGGRVRVEQRPLYLCDGDAGIRKDLGAGKGEKFVGLELYYYSDDTLCVIAKNNIPEKYLQKPLGSEESLTAIDKFLWEYCERVPAYELTTWEPRLMPKDLAEKFGVKAGGPLLVWRQTVYDTAEDAVCGSEVFFSPKFGNPRILRKWTFNPGITSEIL